MIDVRLLMSIGLVMAVPALVGRRWRPRAPLGGSVLDVAFVPLLVGVVVARGVALLLDDPASLTRPSQFMVIRSGMEFWPGVAAGIIVVVVAAIRVGAAPLNRLAVLAPFGLWAYAAYEAGCLLRADCYGPASPIGLHPGGVSQAVFPVGLAVALAVAVLAAGAYRRDNTGALVTVLVSLGGLAALRAAAAVWLPHLGTGLPRPQAQSIAVATVAAAALAAVVLAEVRQPA